jgi:chaperone modulatory protein CbpM
MTSHRIIHHARLNEEVLDQWVEGGWLVPQSTGQRFSSVDLARAYLIRDLQDLGVNDDGIPIILDLVDQVHGLRYVLRELLSTIKTQQGHGRA